MDPRKLLFNGPEMFREPTPTVNQHRRKVRRGAKQLRLLLGLLDLERASLGVKGLCVCVWCVCVVCVLCVCVVCVLCVCVVCVLCVCGV